MKEKYQPLNSGLLKKSLVWKKTCLQQTLLSPSWTHLASPWFRVGSASSPGSRFCLQKQEAGTLLFDIKIGLKNPKLDKEWKKPVSRTGALPAMPRTAHSAQTLRSFSVQLKLFSMGWCVSSYSSILDTYSIPLASCLWERSRESDGQEKPNEGRMKERENQ